MKKTVQQLVFLGATPFPELVDLVIDINKIEKTFEIIGILDDNETLHNTIFCGHKVLGPLIKAHDFDHSVKFVLGIGSHSTRLIRHEILKRLDFPPERYQTLISPFARIFSTAKIGHGCIIDPYAIISCNSMVNNFCTIKANTIIGAGNLLGEGVLFTSLVMSTAHVKIGSFSFIGAHSSIAEGIEIGPGALVSMSTYVTRNVEPGNTVFGNPLKTLSKVEVNEEILGRWETLKEQFNKRNQSSE
ncbi:MAG: acetyltransferase [bacterium]